MSIRVWSQQPAQVLMEAMTSRELAANIASGTNTVLIFSGGTEASGPHLVLGKHNYRIYRYATQIADSLGNTLVAPVLPFAPNSAILEQYPGTISLTEQTFSDVNEQLVRSMVASGFRYIVLMSDHYNSQRPLRNLAARLDSAYRAKGARVFFSSDGYGKARVQIEAGIARQGYVPGGHGGLWDTAETWAVLPTAVRTAYMATGDTTHLGNGPLDAAGVSGDPCPATPEQGKAFGELRVQLAVKEIRQWLSQVKQ
ncbi:creatininase family protein [Chitinophaga rhizophila]|nr:creatininase family protein [Chitinophaga rhizophila]